MSILYLKEHTECTHYLGISNSSFKFFKLNRGSDFILSFTDQYLFLFLLKGDILLTSHSGASLSTTNNKMLSLGYEEDYKGICKTDVEFLTLTFNRPQIRCDEFSLLNLRKYLEDKDKELNFRVLPILPPLSDFLLNILLYLQNEMYCTHLHDIKQSEWFFLMRAFYSKQDNAMFFKPLIEEKNSFILQVKELADSVSNVNELAKACNVSTKTLTRNFKKYFNTTPKKWMLAQKKEKVRLEIMKSGDNMKMVSTHLGFSSSSQLNSYCRKFFDKTPKEIKQEL